MLLGFSFLDFFVLKSNLHVIFMTDSVAIIPIFLTLVARIFSYRLLEKVIIKNPKSIDTILNWTELNWTELKCVFQYFKIMFVHW